MTRSWLDPILPWLPAAAFTIYAKAVLMLHSGVCYNCFSLSRQNPWEKLGELSFFRADFLVGLLLVPAVLVTLSALGRRVGMAIAALLSSLVLVLLAIQLQCLRDAGAFITADLLRDAVMWGWHNRTESSAYFPLADRALLVAGLAAIWIATRLRFPRFPPMVGAVLGGVFLVVAASAWLIPAPASAAHSSILRLAFLPASQWKPRNTAALDELSAHQLVERYRQMAQAPVSERNARYWGRQTGSDVIFFIYETAPALRLPIDGDLTDLPVLARLRQRSIIATNHLSTAPITRLATLSLVNSLYPPTAGYKTLQTRPVKGWPGLPAALATVGYETAIYAPYDPGSTIANYTKQLKAQGFDRIVSTPSSSFRDANQLHDKELHLAEDREAARLLGADIGGYAARDQRYLAVFIPAIGHAPWWDPTKGEIPDIWERGRALLQLQDEMLGGIIGELERHNRLQDTVIVVTSDHGIRTRKEYSKFPVGWVDAISYHVPLLIWAPRAVDDTVAIRHYSSHVDVAPTVADLIGLDRGREFEQGSPIWDPRVGERTTFYLGRFMFGADALRHNEEFIMYRHMTNTTYRGHTLQFREADSHADSGASDLLHRFSALQPALLDRLQSE